MEIPGKQLVCLLHDNRIFAFKKEPTNGVSSSSNEQNVLLNMLTTPKYRAMSVLYIIFRLLDNLSFLSIIILSIIHGTLTPPTPADMSLFSAIGLEIFYDVIVQANKYWILDRLSIYIGITLYAIYFGIVAIKNLNGEYTSQNLVLLCSVLGTRFLAFILEEMVDISIDGMLHNDLLKLQNKKDKERKKENPPPGNSSEIDPLLPKEKAFQTIKNYMNVGTQVEMPDNINYKGSFFAWSPYSVFSGEEVWNKKPFETWLACLLCAFPALFVTIFLGLPLILLCIVASLIPVIVYGIISVCDRNGCKKGVQRIINSNFWKELTYF